MARVGLRVRAIGWLALIVLGFSLASFVVTELFAPRNQVFYELDFPFGPIPALLWVALVASLWLLSRRTPGAPFILAAAAAWSLGFGLRSVHDGPLEVIALYCWTTGPVLLGIALRKSGYPRSVWVTSLLWGCVATGALAVSHAATLLLPHPAFMAVAEVAYAAVFLVVPVLRWLFLGFLGVSLLMERASGGAPNQGVNPTTPCELHSGPERA